jgi:hypothetical protein
VKLSFSRKAVMLPIPDREKQTHIINLFFPIDDHTRVGRSMPTPLDSAETGRTLSINIIHFPKNLGNREIR